MKAASLQFIAFFGLPEFADRLLFFGTWKSFFAVIYGLNFLFFA
jgi:hypothetical protein